MAVIFGLGTRLLVYMRTTLENGVVRNRQQPGHFRNRKLLHLDVFRVAFGHLYESS